MFLDTLRTWMLVGWRHHDGIHLGREVHSWPVRIEQFERRFCLGSAASPQLADDALLPADVAEAGEVLVVNGLEEVATKVPSDRAQVEVPPTGSLQPSSYRVETNESDVELPPATSDELLPLLESPLGSVDDGVTGATFSINGQTSRASPLLVMDVLVRDESSASQASDSDGASATPPLTDDFLSLPISTAASGAILNFTSSNTEAASFSTITPTATATGQLDAAEVEQLLERAAAASASDDAIIAVVDRFGRILGVRAEASVLATIPDTDTLVFAIDGAVAKARTAALFSNGDPDEGTLAPLTSRTVRFISQSTITQREVESNPNVDGTDAADAAASTTRGPGFVAPIGVGGHFPPEVAYTPLVDLFGIEHTNRDSLLHPGVDGIKGTADDIDLRARFNIDPAFVPAGQEIFAPESYGYVSNSGLLPDAQSRGIATLPGGIPLFRDTNGNGFGDKLIGGIGVFFPGSDGYATYEQGFVEGVGQTEQERINADRVLESEYIAFAAAGGSLGGAAVVPGAKIGNINGVAPVADLDLPFGRLDLVGIQLDVFGPMGAQIGLQTLLDKGATLGAGDPNSGADQPLMAPDGFHREGLDVPEGILVTPHDSSVNDLTAADVQLIIDQAIEAANKTRAAVRLPLGSRTEMVFAITDTTGEVLGLYRMDNATTFSIDVAVAKARNVAYYADPGDIQTVDQVTATGTAFTNRTFRFLAQPRYPSGIDGTPPPAFSILNDDSIAPLTAENLGAPATVSEFDSVLGNDAFFPMSNFRDPGNPSVVAAGGGDPRVANQNGVVFFPGSIPIYKDGVLVGGFGVSGDGVEQDDVVTFLGALGFRPDDTITRADQTFVDGVRLPFQKFLRNPFG